MELLSFLQSKPVLIGIHLGFAILAIDAFLWLLGEVVANAGSVTRRKVTAIIGLVGYIITWIVGGYYYVVYYGPLVKPVIKAGNAPWAHAIAMEAKEHIFLFAVPIAVTVYFLARLDSAELQNLKIRSHMIHLIIILAAIGLSLGLLGFIISAAARWG